MTGKNTDDYEELMDKIRFFSKRVWDREEEARRLQADAYLIRYKYLDPLCAEARRRRENAQDDRD